MKGIYHKRRCPPGSRGEIFRGVEIQPRSEMASALPVSAALSIIQAVIKVRGQVDTIVSVHRAAEQLPFLLPDVPNRKDRPHREKMKAYFASPEGIALLIASGNEPAFRQFLDLEIQGQSPENALGSRPIL